MKKIILSILLAVSLLATCSAFAMSETMECRNEEGGKITITGSAEAGESVTVRVFKKAKHLDSDGNFDYAKAQQDLKDAEKMRSVICFADETVADEDGMFTFNAKLSKLLGDTGAVSDIYVAVAISKSGTAFSEFLFVDPSESDTDYETLSGMKNETEEKVVEFLEAHKYALGIYSPLFDVIGDETAYGTIYDYLVSEDFDVEDSSIASKDIQKLLVIEALSQGKLDTIEDYEYELALLESDIYTWYSKELVDEEFKKALTTALSGKSYGDIASFDGALKRELIFAWLVNGDSIDDCVAIINDYKEDIGFSEDDEISVDAVREIMGTDFDSYSDLKDAIDIDKDEAKDDKDDDNDTSSKKPASRPSSGGGFGSVTVSGGTVTPAPQAINSYYNDINSVPWAIDAINYLSEKKVLLGKENGIFAPNDNVTRAEFAKILVSAFGLTNKADIAFADVDENSWYADFVKIAVGSGIAKGTSETTFGPEENITRQDMAVMLMNAAKLAKNMAEADGNVSFADEAEISDYAKSAVNTLTKAGIINGTGDGKFAPKANATRAQAAKLVHGLMTYK